MRIVWLGHSCFAIQHDSIRLIFDPFNPQMVGYPALRLHADMVCISHEHDDHNYVKAIEGTPLVIRGSGKHKAPPGWKIQGFDSFHDQQQGSQRGNNTMFKIQTGGISVLHCGDLGALPDKDTLSNIGKIDVLMVPVGGFYTIDAHQAATLCNMLKPLFVLPMHYHTPYIPSFPISNEKEFINLINAPTTYRVQCLELDAFTLASQTDLHSVLFDLPISVQGVDSLLDKTIE